MPAQLSFFDMEASTTPPGPGYFVAYPITLGPNWQPNDIRVVFQVWRMFSNTDTNANSQFNITYLNPPGFTDGVDVEPQDVSSGAGAAYYRLGMSWRRLVAGDTDTFVVYNRPDISTIFNFATFTVRGVDPSFTPAPAAFSGLGPYNTAIAEPAGTQVVSSVSVPSAGTMTVFMASSNYAVSSVATTGAALGIPSGWTNLVATANSGLAYTPYNNTAAAMVVAKAFSSSGSTGGISFPFANSIAPFFQGITTFWKPGQDVSFTATSPTNPAATASAATFSVSTAVTATAPGATSTATATTAFNPLYGQWVSDPVTLPGNPVTGSVVRWTATTPVRTTVFIETSINNGASWDAAIVNGSVPRLATGDTTTRSVLVRATLTRTNATDPPPRVLTLEVQVSVDAGTDELVPVGHGMVDRVTTTAVGGSTGTGSITSVVSSTAVTSRGGGQTGGGASIKIHVTDLSGSIKRNAWAMPFTLPGGMNYGAAAKAMVLDRLPSQTDFAISSTNVQTPLLVYGMQQGGDPWQDIQDLATAIGFEAFFDASGIFVFRPVPDPSVGDPVWEFDETSNPLVSEASRELSNEQTFNHIVVMGQSTSTQNPVTAEAFDNNPSSPTYILGPFGEVTERVTFSTVTTQDQAQATANALLFNSLGGADTVTITCVPMPALEPGDIVKVNILDVNADGNYMINSMTTSLSPADPQQLVCFRQSTS